jgi:archaellum component FlaG (FlaF/FlaG flagellin family)
MMVSEHFSKMAMFVLALLLAATPLTVLSAGDANGMLAKPR